MISIAKFNLGGESNFSVFSIAILAAAISNYIPIGIIFALGGIGTFIGYGLEGLLNFVFSSFILFIITAIRKPIVRQNQNEKRRIGIHLFIAIVLAKFIPMAFNTFYLYDFLMGILTVISVVIFYKIFSNSVTVFKDFGDKLVFSIEEIISASLCITIAFTVLEPFKIFGFSIKNILSVLIVLILGWKHGILVGGTSGITIGIVLGIIGRRRTNYDSFICNFWNDCWLI